MIIIMALTIIIGILLFLNDRRVYDVDLLGVAKFLAMMFIIMVAKVCWYSYSAPNLNLYSLMPHTHWRLGLVFWEDIVFTGVIILSQKYVNNNIIRYLIIILSSIVFGMGHIYQGYIPAIIISLYPYFISYRYSKRVGLGTVMICHVLYDHIVVYGTILIIQNFSSFWI